MNMKKILLFTLPILVLLLFALVFALPNSSSTKAMLRVPDISLGRVAGFADHIKAAPGIAETSDAREIIAVVNRAYDLMGTAARTFDVSDFPSVFIDTPDANLSRSQKKAIEQILGVEAAEGAGYLTCMLAYYGAWEKGATQLEAAILKAKAENREITADELKAIINANHGRVPAPRREDPMYKTPLEFRSIDVKEDKALVVYDDGAALQEMILVKSGEQWFIASIKPIWVHF